MSSMSSKFSNHRQIRLCTCALILGVVARAPAAQAPSSFQGSVAQGEVSAQPVNLSLDEAIQRGLKTNLGIILSSAQSAAARGQRLS